MKTTLFAISALALVPSLASAQDSLISIGGPGSFGGAGSFDPGTLDDGTTLATARLIFHLDTAGAQLVLTVENTSPVLAGVPNPMLTDVFWNTPAAITGMALVGQSGAGGATPDWDLTFDADLGSNPNPNGANGFGAYNAHINPKDVKNSIANPAADTIGIPPGSWIVGPAVFTFDLTGDLTGLTAASFTTLLSVNPPGNHSFTAACKFQAGGPQLISGFLSPGSYCQIIATSEIVAGGCGNAMLSTTLPLMGSTGTVFLTNATPGVCAVVLVQPGTGANIPFRGCTLLLNPAQSYRLGVMLTDGNGDATLSVHVPSVVESPTCCGAEFRIQAATFAKPAGGGMQMLEITNGVQIQLGN